MMSLERWRIRMKKCLWYQISRSKFLRGTTSLFCAGNLYTNMETYSSKWFSNSQAYNYLGSHHTLKKQLNHKTLTRARKMTQQDKAPTADQPPGSHMVGGGNQLLRTSVNTILGVKTVLVLCDLGSQPEALPASCQHAQRFKRSSHVYLSQTIHFKAHDC